MCSNNLEFAEYDTLDIDIKFKMLKARANKINEATYVEVGVNVFGESDAENKYYSAPVMMDFGM